MGRRRGLAAQAGAGDRGRLRGWCVRKSEVDAEYPRGDSGEPNVREYVLVYDVGAWPRFYWLPYGEPAVFSDLAEACAKALEFEGRVEEVA